MQSLQVTLRFLKKDAPESDVKAASTVMHEAFYDDTLYSFLVGGHKELLFDIQQALIKAGLVGGKVYVAENSSGTIVGAAILFGPGEELLNSDEQINAGFGQFMGALAAKEPQMTAWWMEYFLPAYAEFTTRALGSAEKKSSAWNLMLLGVLPSYQRRGVGTTIVKSIEKMIASSSDTNADTKKLYLETADVSKSLFAGLGFAAKSSLEIKSDEKMNQSLMKYCCVKVLKDLS